MHVFSKFHCVDRKLISSTRASIIFQMFRRLVFETCFSTVLVSISTRPYIVKVTKTHRNNRSVNITETSVNFTGKSAKTYWKNAKFTGRKCKVYTKKCKFHSKYVKFTEKKNTEKSANLILNEKVKCLYGPNTLP